MAAIYTLDGNIGSGKSTLLKRIEDMQIENVVCVYEPVDEWMKMKPEGYDKSIFEMYYENKQRYAFIFQLYALQSRVAHMAKIIKENPGKIIITERCHLTDCNVFAQMLMEDNHMSVMEFAVYKTWYDFMVQLINPNIKGILYIDASPETCVTRIIKRMRSGENNIDIKYLVRLHLFHEKWLKNPDYDVPILVIDGNKEIGKSVLTSVESFIKSGL